MKKILFSIICLLTISSVDLVRAYDDSWTNGVEVSTVAFSSSTVVAFVGKGLVWGIGNSSSSVLSFFDLYDSSEIVNQAGTNSRDQRRRMRYQNFGVSQTSIAVTSAGDTWFFKPIRFKAGCAWLFSDQTANNARLYYTDEGH